MEEDDGEYHEHYSRRRENICTTITSLPFILSTRVMDCFATSSIVEMESGRRVRLLHQIAEGGFSYVYEGLDVSTGRQYAVKKVLCQTLDQKEEIRREISHHKRFKHPNLLPLIDYSVESSHTGYEYYLLFPLYQKGTLRQFINQFAAGDTRIQERDLLQIFQKLCDGVAEMHTHHLVHRDIKPENVLLSHELNPVLMDFGSAACSEVVISNRNEALQLQDQAAQHCSMPYRAPELFDVPSQCVITAATDIWSLGCVMYAMAFGYSPFECEFTSSNELRIVECTHLRVIGNWSFPTRISYSAAFCDLIRWMLTLDPLQRPTISKVLDQIQKLLNRTK